MLQYLKWLQEKDNDSATILAARYPVLKILSINLCSKFLSQVRQYRKWTVTMYEFFRRKRSLKRTDEKLGWRVTAR